ncbi:dehydrogenase [Sphaerisporangium siamense]|uniref:NAD(P)-dependent dehydrogenase (Short-subunit alcohol dehydrogenase family) n=1 Tax=Sphaerisporangium siamense TaxID=795645 RepID=A0A7W7G8C8_9ACTN|nr:SDR family oxidoreductase [Sphaerisporangium siamense]MBB4701633.1 NAD(P)-dependent dehydrogenase (short-subunit alcohol dehydrogenase family) [Sphaerisporangium siamense]GII85758.1 dehydrogenase [Sphaerisporangium siamense]
MGDPHGPDGRRAPGVTGGGRDRPVTALVTGANQGIGREIAARLAGLGMTVLLGARDPRKGEEAARDLRAAGGEVRAVQLDVTDGVSIKSAAQYVGERFGVLDVLVNNAGILGDSVGQAPGTAELDVVRQVFETNVFGVIGVTTAMIPYLLRSPAGRVVNVTSGLGSLTLMSDPEGVFGGRPASVAYVPSKTALNSLTVQYARELRPHGILVNAADPGLCATAFTHGVPGLTRTAADGAAIAVRLATLPDNGPTGGCFGEHGPIPW